MTWIADDIYRQKTVVNYMNYPEPRRRASPNRNRYECKTLNRRPVLRAPNLRWSLPVTTSEKVSSTSWAALAISAAFLLVFAFAVTQEIHERPAIEEAAPTPADESPDKANEAAEQASDVAPQVWEPNTGTDDAPESTVKELVQAWNQGDADKIAKLFLPDGVLRLPTGSEIKSREEIKNTVAQHHDGMLKDTKLTNSIHGVSTNGDNAVVKGNYQLEGIKVLGFSTSSTGSYEFHGIKREGRWLIAKAEVSRE